MTTKQIPLNSGFTAASTTTDVLAGIDLSGRNAIVTAGHVGLGLETTKALAQAGASVVVGARSPGRAAAALAGIERVEVYPLDLMAPTSITAFASRYRASGKPLHILVNNAGIMGGDLVRDARGYESQFGTNHLGHFQLTLALLHALRAAEGARVVAVSSWGHHLSDIRWDDPHFEHGPYSGAIAYGQSKTANSLFAVELDRGFADDGIRGYALHPGDIAATNLFGPWLAGNQLRAMELIDESGDLIIDPERGRKTPQQGASTSVWAATSPQLAGIGGVYLHNNDIAPLDGLTKPLEWGTAAGPMDTTSGVTSYAVDPESAQRLWELSRNLILD